MFKTLEYYYADGSHVVFDKYIIDTWGVIRNKKTCKVLSPHKKGTYHKCCVQDNSGKGRNILIGRAIASTFIDIPPSTDHTADHIDRKSTNDTTDNIRWLGQSGQKNNQERPPVYKNAFIIVKDETERTVKEWVYHFKDSHNPYGRKYTEKMINHYTQNNQHGFSYKKYPDLPGEVWKRVEKSENWRNYWMISNMNRVKYITKNAENVLSGERLGMSNDGYPIISINNKNWRCHILSFMTFFPEEYSTKKPNEFVLHEDDNKLDFRPHRLRIGTRQDNTTDAHDNGKYDGTKTERMRCSSYIDGRFEKEYESQHDAVRYLKSIGYDKASQGYICRSLLGYRKTAYGRTWALI
jgi:hypothetical protein